MTYPLGRVHAPDSRDANFPMSLHLDTVPGTWRTYRYWPGGPNIFDQNVALNVSGGHGSCVGFTGADWLTCSPVRDKGITSMTGVELYNACKAYDGYAGDGSNDRALMKVMQDRRRVGRYLWATSIDELRQWILTTGPVMVGSRWTESMFTPDSRGYVSPEGVPVGGHEYLVRGYSPSKGYRCRNHWGATWGQNGEFWLTEGALNSLAFYGGDACAAVEKPL